jgi:hypothetical protein
MINNINRDAILSHLIRMAQVDKAYAWQASKDYAKLFDGWSDLPELLAAHMKQLKAESTKLEN